MGTFTIPLKEVLEYQTNIGLDEYPIFDENYREGLNKKIIDHFWNQEIGLETVEMFTFAMRRKMNEIMPLYNKIYIEKAKEIDPLVNFRTKALSTTEQESTATGADSQTATNTGNETQQGSNESSSVAKSRAVNSDFPQQMLTGTGDYATSAVDSNSDGAVTGTNESTSASTTQATGQGQSTNNAETSASMEQSSEGFTGVSFASILAEYRDNFINTDMLIIDDLKELFMQLWNNGDSYTEGGFPSWPYPGW